MDARLPALGNTLEPILSVQLVPLVTAAPIRPATNPILAGFPTKNLANPTNLIPSIPLVTPTNPRTLTNPIHATLGTVRFAAPLNQAVQLVADANPRCNALPVDAIVTNRNALIIDPGEPGVALAHLWGDAAAVGAVGAADGEALVLGGQPEAVVAGARVWDDAAVAGSGADGFADEGG